MLVVQLLSFVWLFATPRTAAQQAPLCLLPPGVCSNSCPLSWWCHPTTSSSAEPWCWKRLRAGGEGGDRGWQCLPNISNFGKFHLKLGISSFFRWTRRSDDSGFILLRGKSWLGSRVASHFRMCTGAPMGAVLLLSDALLFFFNFIFKFYFWCTSTLKHHQEFTEVFLFACLFLSFLAVSRYVGS